MKYVFLLSKEDLKLAKQEALSLFNLKKHRLANNLLFFDSNDIESVDRLAYTRKIYQFLFETNKKNLINNIKNFNWQSIYKDNFCVRIHRIGNSKIEKSEKDLAGYIWRKLKNPKVNLKNPKTSIEFFITKDSIYATKLIKELKQDFESRKAHRRPELHPTSLNPKLARALINLAGAQKEIIDPFCGAGGILIEAGLMNLRPIGYDLCNIMLKRAKTNLDYYKIKDYKLMNEDALKIKKKYNYIITDLPYGLNTSIWIKKSNKNKKISLKQTDKKEKIKNLEGFYLKFLKNLKKILKKKAVIIFPHYVNYKKLIKLLNSENSKGLENSKNFQNKANLKIGKEFSQYVHGSLIRKIVVLSLRKKKLRD